MLQGNKPSVTYILATARRLHGRWWPHIIISGLAIVVGHCFYNCWQHGFSWDIAHLVASELWSKWMKAPFRNWPRKVNRTNPYNALQLTMPLQPILQYSNKSKPSQTASGPFSLKNLNRSLGSSPEVPSLCCRWRGHQYLWRWKWTTSPTSPVAGGWQDNDMTCKLPDWVSPM